MSNYKNITICPSNLQQGYTTYSPLALRYLFNRKKVSHILNFNRDKNNNEQQKILICKIIKTENKTKIKIDFEITKFSKK